jgi:hypothetical protein
MKKQYIQMVATISDHLLHIQPLHPRQGTAPDPAGTLHAKNLGPLKNNMEKGFHITSSQPSSLALDPSW